jgi:hypothetical protein
VFRYRCGSHHRRDRPVAETDGTSRRGRRRRLPAGLGSVGYTFEVGKLPISTRIKVFREFDVQNRFEGTAGYFTVSLPVGIDTNAQAIPGKMIKARF